MIDSICDKYEVLMGKYFDKDGILNGVGEIELDKLEYHILKKIFKDLDKVRISYLYDYEDYDYEDNEEVKLLEYTNRIPETCNRIEVIKEKVLQYLQSYDYTCSCNECGNSSVYDQYANKIVSEPYEVNMNEEYPTRKIKKVLPCSKCGKNPIGACELVDCCEVILWEQ